jgi:hypothetical protein
MLGSFLQKAAPFTRAFLIAALLVLGTMASSAAHPIQASGAELLELSEPRPAAASEISPYASPVVPPPDQTQNRFSTLLPHGVCILWDKPLLVLHVLSDSLIAFSYFSIPLALVHFVRRRRDLAFNWIFILFAAFIVACGLTHVMGVWTLWEPVYWLDGMVKAFTAAISLVTALILWPLIPKVLALPSPAQLAAANKELEDQIAERRRAEERWKTNAEELERFSCMAVGRERRMIELKQQVNDLSRALGKPAPYDLSFAGK